MFTSRVLVSSAVRACQNQFDIWQRLQRFTCSALLGIEDHFIEREFEKARENLDIDALDNTDVLLQKLERDQNRRIKATQRARTARLFKTQNDPRTITWDTMEQIRYLKQEQGDEWSVKRLAHSFQVSEAVIIKVLKSKFVPTDKRRSKQDMKAKINTNLLSEGTVSTDKEVKQTLPSPFSKTYLLDSVQNKHPQDDGLERVFSNSKRKAIQKQKISGQQTQKLTGKVKSTAPQTKPIPEAVKEHGHVGGKACSENFHKPMPIGSKQPFSKSFSNPSSRSGQKGHQQALKNDHFSRGWQSSGPFEGGTPEEESPLNFDMENLESYDDGSPPPQIVRRGNEFFDDKGQFLFRV